MYIFQDCQPVCATEASEFLEAMPYSNMYIFNIYMKYSIFIMIIIIAKTIAMRYNNVKQI